MSTKTAIAASTASSIEQLNKTAVTRLREFSRISDAAASKLNELDTISRSAADLIAKVVAAKAGFHERMAKPAAVPALVTVSSSAQRFTKLDANDNPLPDDASEWAWVRDARTGLIWPAEIIEGEFTQAAAIEAASKAGKDSRAPELQELVAVLDYTRSGPAADTTFFRWKSKWVWTATKAAAPLGFAWLVSLRDGHSGVLRQDFRSCALAVRVSQ